MKSQVSTLQTKYERSEANVNHLENEIIKERAQLEAVNKEMIEKYKKIDDQIKEKTNAIDLIEKTNDFVHLHLDNLT